MNSLVISLHDRATELQYPESLQSEIALLFGRQVQDPAARRADRVIAVGEIGPDRYAISGDSKHRGAGLDAAELLDVLLEDVAGSLVDELDSAVALHAAAVGWDGKSIVIPGPTGCGKTSLAGWFTARDFEFLSDELVAIAGNAVATLSHPRPLLVKPGFDALPAMLAHHARTLRTAGGVAICPSVPATAQERQAGLVIFPRYVAGGKLEIAPVSPAMACLKLMECNLNGRNLGDHGLQILSDFARGVPALRLSYGDYDQLDGVADTLVKFVINEGVSGPALNTFMSAFRPRSDSGGAQSEWQTAGASPAAAFTDWANTNSETSPPERKLTIGMATYDDYDGVYFSLQAIRLFHPEISEKVEFLVIDNNPAGQCAQPLKDLENWIPNYRYVPKGNVSGTAIRDWVFSEARTEFVLCMDCHVFVAPGALKRLIDYFTANPDTPDLVQGPLIYDDLKSYSTHFKPGWQAGMYGSWDAEPGADDAESPPFEIPMQGLGLFACRRRAWPGFNPAFRGFGGEEGYIHEKFRQRGGKTLCLPFLRWLHRFSRPMGASYPNRWDDRVHNYLTGFREVGWDTAPIIEHFRELLRPQEWEAIVASLGHAMLYGESDQADRTSIVAAESDAQPLFKAEPVFSGEPARPWLKSGKARFGSNPQWLGGK